MTGTERRPQDQFETAQAQSAVRWYFDQAAANWDAHSQTDPALLRAIVSIANPAKGARILDVACGTGVMFEPLLERQPALLRAIDLSPEMARRAVLRMPEYPALRISATDFYLFTETGFDLIMVYNAYPHFLDKGAFARKLRDCLAPGGRFVIAQGAGRERINACHAGAHVRPVSSPLMSCRDEAKQLGSGFCFDVMADCGHLYLLSGTLAEQK